MQLQKNKLPKQLKLRTSSALSLKSKGSSRLSRVKNISKPRAGKHSAHFSELSQEKNLSFDMQMVLMRLTLRSLSFATGRLSAEVLLSAHGKKKDGQVLMSTLYAAWLSLGQLEKLFEWALAGSLPSQGIPQHRQKKYQRKKRPSTRLSLKKK